MKFKELSYANETDPLLKRLVIRSIENISGRNKYIEVYKIWRSEVVGKSDRVFSRMLELIDIDLSARMVKAIREAVGTRADILFGTHGQFTASGALRMAQGWRQGLVAQQGQHAQAGVTGVPALHRGLLADGQHRPVPAGQIGGRAQGSHRPRGDAGQLERWCHVRRP